MDDTEEYKNSQKESKSGRPECKISHQENEENNEKDLDNQNDQNKENDKNSESSEESSPSSPTAYTHLVKPRRVRKAISLEQKLDVITRYERNETSAQIQAATGLGDSTIRTIRDNAEKIKANCAVANSLGARRISRTRPQIMGAMEKELAAWIEKKNQLNIPLQISCINDKALAIFKKLSRKYPAKEVTSFTASRGWFQRFKKRQNISYISVSGFVKATEEGSSNDDKIDPIKQEDLLEFDDTEFISMAHLEDQDSIKFEEESYMMVDEPPVQEEKRIKLEDYKVEDSPAKQRDEFDAYAEYIACKLRSLDKRSSCFVQKKIADLIFEAEMGKYKDEGSGSSFTQL